MGILCTFKKYNTVCTELPFNHHLTTIVGNPRLIPIHWERNVSESTVGYRRCLTTKWSYFFMKSVCFIWYAVWLLQNSECMIKGRNPHCFYSLFINWCTLCYTLTVYHWLYGMFYWCSVWYHRILFLQNTEFILDRSNIYHFHVILNLSMHNRMT